MSGHSHFKSIKHKKEASDKKRGKIFSKLAKEITIAAKNNGDPESNPRLRTAVEKARQFNMPKENIERAIKKGTGEMADENLEEIVLEAYGPGKSAILIEIITDNKNRALSQIKQILSQYGGKLASEGSVKWLFDKKGYLEIDPKEQEENIKIDDLELMAIETGVEDVSHGQNVLEIYAKIEDLEKIKKSLEEKGVKIESSSLSWKPKEEIAVEEKDGIACEKLFEALDENDNVQEIYSNLKG